MLRYKVKKYHGPRWPRPQGRNKPAKEGWFSIVATVELNSNRRLDTRQKRELALLLGGDVAVESRKRVPILDKVRIPPTW